MKDKEDKLKKLQQAAGRTAFCLGESHMVRPTAKQAGRMAKLLQPQNVNAKAKDKK